MLPWSVADDLIEKDWAVVTTDELSPDDTMKWTGPLLDDEPSEDVVDLRSQLAMMKDQMLAFMASQQGRVELSIPDVTRAKPGPKPRYRDPNPDNAATVAEAKPVSEDQAA